MAGGRTSLGGSPDSSSSSRGGLYANMKCNCGLDVVVRTMKKGPNDTDCNFMKWVDCNNGDDLRFHIFERETKIAELEMHKAMLEDKVKRLQGKKENFADELQEMKAEIT
uniref:Uncharacterized protein n=1 Tax=Chenopodium quinoa TaxID=63459 RepID=A0A803KUF7_CHEQI